jgi:protein-S-isoprenylcysteine O-methyltransferase Ste14
MSDNADAPSVVIHPPIAMGVALVICLGLGWIYPLPIPLAVVPRFLIGAAFFAAAVLLMIWSGKVFRNAHTEVNITRPATTIVDTGPYRFSRNPIYVGMFAGLIALALFFGSFWPLVALVILYFVIRFGVVAREESYLERKFGPVYLGYKVQVRRWL